MQRSLKSLLAIALVTGAASAQGADDCSSATLISGTGTFTFDNSSATTDGGPASCSMIENDVWFRWTPGAVDNYIVETCDGTTVDTVIGIRANSCGASEIGCADISCGLQSSLPISATATEYLIRIGGYQGNSGTGTFVIRIDDGATTGECANPSPGPDVIVGELTGPAKYNGVGGVGAYSIGTTSCNVGQAELQWQANNPNHPVIGQNIYRYENQRFEQLGLSYLKHGFFALQGNLCCNCIHAGTGTRLGVGCSDPYGAGLNGSQSGLGPRWQVNAHTGAFPFPFSQQGQGGNSIFKRIQVANSDLDPATHASARIVGEAQYITPDDAAAGNGNNNTSWREINVGSFSSGSYNLNWANSTQRRDPAIRAWAVFDNTVELTDVQIPNEGLFVVGNDATDNGDGTWDYEYAVYNMNSHVSAGSFSVPVPAGVSVTGIGFHDVDYHSGEPFDGTDWTGVRGSSDVSWSTDTFISNPNANAIRWGTLYNFRFTADAAPAAASATLGMFRPHTPTSVAVAVRAPDDCPPVVATETVRAGSPANPLALLVGQTSRPIIGSTWDPIITHATFYPSATADFLAVNPDGVQLNVPLALGTLLCNPPAPVFISFAAPGVAFTVGIPNDCSLVGRPVCSQGGSVGNLGLQVTNALDLVLGNM